MNWFESFFAQPHDPGSDDCDQCLAERAANPDWYRMGLTAPRKRARDLSTANPRVFLDQLVHLREQYGATDDDKGTGQSVESFLAEKQKSNKKKGKVLLDGHPISTDFTLFFEPYRHSGPGSAGDDE